MSYSESSSKINLGSRWTVFQILLMSAVEFKNFSMKTRLRNISKNTNATDFNKAILEMSFKVLLATCNLAGLKWPVCLLRALQF